MARMIGLGRRMIDEIGELRVGSVHMIICKPGALFSDR